MDLPAQAEEEKVKTWKTTSVEGLYVHENGTYYSRFRLNGKRTFRSLKTKAFSVAKTRHKRDASDREDARQGGATLDANFATLGALAAELTQRIDTNETDPVTKLTQKFAVTRLRRHWDEELPTISQPSSFDSTLARSVSLSTALRLRSRMLKTAVRSHNRSSKTFVGYRPATVNQTLWVLKLILDIAVEKFVLLRHPFDEVGALQESVFISARSKKPDLPRREDMERVFAAMLHVPNEDKIPVELRARFHANARDVQEHARFIAYSGMRVSEANSAMIEDDQGEMMRVRGTKSTSSERFIPVHAKLRSLLDEIKARGKTGRFLTVTKSIEALKRVCARIEVKRLTHHALRHYFATICIEEGVDIPTVSRWLGHSDGGALAMRVYGHLRQEHSVAAMKRVSFSPRTVAQSKPE